MLPPCWLPDEPPRESSRPTVRGLMLLVGKWALIFAVIAAVFRAVPEAGGPVLAVLAGGSLFVRIVYRDFRNPFG
jgi:hypothetical protein